MKSLTRNVLFASFFVLIFSSTGIIIFIDYNSSKDRLIIATTTSTYDSGLLDYLLPVFEEENKVNVEILSVGTGQAIAHGQSGDCDLILVHSRLRENLFVAEGHGIHRTCVMYNDFVIVGPISDPANISGNNITEAMSKLKNSGTSNIIKFYSRGDNSGTHSKELELWNLANIIPDAELDEWYLELGSGMGTTLTVTNENDGYTLIDRGTWLANKNSVSLTILVEEDTVLLNPYGAILVNPDKYSSVNYKLATKFIGFLSSKRGQEMIGNYTKNGEILFHPSFGICDDIINCNTTNEEVNYWKDQNGNYSGPNSAISSDYLKSTLIEII